MKEKSSESYGITLKGILFMALGGYKAEHFGEKSKEHTDKIIECLKGLLSDGSVITLVGDEPRLVKMVKPSKKGFWRNLI
jgi:hypothetical protein